jgi:4-amino-4-deoxy-L-arabinose transferase-like glycosyltransferase
MALRLGLAITVALAFRLAIVTDFSTPTPDGEQYYALARSLAHAHKLSFGTLSPPSYTRLPGYPVFLAAVAPTRGPQEEHARSASRANALLDVCTALMVLFMLRDAGLKRAPAIGFAAVIVFPLLILFSTQVLSEPLATCLTTLSLWLALRARQRESLRYAAGAGVATGLALLVRADCVSLLVAMVVVLLPRRRLAALCVALALLVYAPWPVRNLAQFGAPHFTGAQWPRQDGEPLRTGPIWWMRTWSSGAVHEAHFADHIVFGHTVHANQVLISEMYDDESERQQLAALFERIGDRGITPEIDAEFLSLARARFARHPIRCLIGLPLLRAFRVLSPPHPATITWARIRLLGLPRSHIMLPIAQVIAIALALAGVWLSRRDRALRPLLLGAGAVIVCRVLIHAVAIPHGVEARYFVEALPALLALAAVGAERITTRNSENT